MESSGFFVFFCKVASGISRNQFPSSFPWFSRAAHWPHRPAKLRTLWRPSETRMPQSSLVDGTWVDRFVGSDCFGLLSINHGVVFCLLVFMLLSWDVFVWKLRALPSRCHITIKDQGSIMEVWGTMCWTFSTRQINQKKVDGDPLQKHFFVKGWCYVFHLALAQQVFTVLLLSSWWIFLFCPLCLLANHLFRKGTTTLSLCSPGITCVGTKVSDKRFTLHLAPKGHRNWVAALVGNSLQKPGLVELEICLFRGGAAEIEICAIFTINSDMASRFSVGGCSDWYFVGKCFIFCR